MKVFFAFLVFSLAAGAGPLSAADDRVFEMRTYFANEGKLDALHARFRDHTVALFEKHGMTNIGYWAPLDNSENKLTYILAYESREARMKAWRAFLSDEKWKAAFKASVADGKLVNRIVNRFFVATDYSPPVKSSLSKKERVFELRVYSTAEGKLGNLDTRFRDATMTLFERHGMENVGYWHLMGDQEDAESKLVYLIAHESVESRAASWKAFGGDPDWKGVREKSVEDAGGPLLIKDGVKSELLAPTDYSPMR